MSRYFWPIFTPPSLCHTSSHIPEHPESTSHISDPPISRRPSSLQKTRTEAPLYKFCFNCSLRFLSGGFVKGSFVLKVLSGVGSRSVRIHLLHQKVKHHFKFHVSYVWDIFLKCDVTCSLPLPLSQTVTPSRTPPLERDVLYGRPLLRPSR